MRVRTKVVVVVGLLAALVLAGVVSSYASGAPDGLTKVAEQLGFNKSEDPHALGKGPMAGYSTDGIDSGWLSGGVAGVAGVAVTFVAGGAVFAAVRKRGARGDPDAADGRGEPVQRRE